MAADAPSTPPKPAWNQAPHPPFATAHRRAGNTKGLVRYTAVRTASMYALWKLMDFSADSLDARIGGGSIIRAMTDYAWYIFSVYLALLLGDAAWAAAALRLWPPQAATNLDQKQALLWGLPESVGVQMATPDGASQRSAPVQQQQQQQQQPFPAISPLRSQRVVSTPPGEQRGLAAQEQQATPASAGHCGRTPERSPYTRSPYGATGSPLVTTPEQLRQYMDQFEADVAPQPVAEAGMGGFSFGTPGTPYRDAGVGSWGSLYDEAQPTQEGRSAGLKTGVQAPIYRPSVLPTRAGGGGAGVGGGGLDWELDGANLELCRRDDGSPWQLGQGSFGTVYKALSHGVQPVAVKIFPTHATPKQHAEFQREVVLLKSCRDGNIVQFLGASQTESQTLMITEYMENGDLFSAIRKDPTGRLLWYRKDAAGRGEPGLGRQIALDIARGLHFLHRHQVVHFDLKSPNVLLGRQFVAKIADVGLAKILQKDYVSSLQSVGTFAWSAPEVLLGARCSEKVDIYGLGVMLWELVTGESPARGRLRAVRVPEECPAAVAELITRCMDSKSSNRPSAKEVVVILSQQAADRSRSGPPRAAADDPAAASKKAPDAECSEELIAAIVNMCHVVGGPASGITREEAIAAATFKDELHTYKMYVREVQKTLAMPGVETEDSKAHRRLVQLVESHRAVMVIFMQEHTNTIRRFQFVSLQEAAAYVAKSEKPGGAPPQQEATTVQPSLDWSLILESLELTPHQSKSLIAARAVVVHRLRAITDERKRLMAALHSFVLQAPQSGGFVSAVDHSEGLKANLEEEGALLQDFHIVFTCKTLTALQQARLEVGAFPCLPDAMTVCGLLAQEANPPTPTPSTVKASAVAATPRAAQLNSELGAPGLGTTSSTLRARSL